VAREATRRCLCLRQGVGGAGSSAEDYASIAREYAAQIQSLGVSDMDFSAVALTEAQQAFAGEVREFLDEHLTPEVYARVRERAEHFDEEFYVALGAKGWLRPRWRREDGGAELDDVCVRILETELRKRDAPVGGDSADWVWPAVQAYADPGLRDELKPQVARGTVRISLGYTEPDGGSDIAGAKTRAVRDGDEWVINGQKIFTTGAHNNQYVFLITRTDPALPKHKGLTMFLVPLDTPGIEVHALPTVGDERTNITYYSDVRISDRYRMGEVNNGWTVLHGPLDTEHSLDDRPSKLEDLSTFGASAMRYMIKAVEPATRWAQDAPGGDGAMIDDKAFLSGLGRILVQIEGATCTPLRPAG
jgi:alkylation response protein AidB-like acyl-CoA dehydrogenase